MSEYKDGRIVLSSSAAEILSQRLNHPSADTITCRSNFLKDINTNIHFINSDADLVAAEITDFDDSFLDDPNFAKSEKTMTWNSWTSFSSSPSCIECDLGIPSDVPSDAPYTIKISSHFYPNHSCTECNLFSSPDVPYTTNIISPRSPKSDDWIFIYFNQQNELSA